MKLIEIVIIVMTKFFNNFIKVKIIFIIIKQIILLFLINNSIFRKNKIMIQIKVF